MKRLALVLLLAACAPTTSEELTRGAARAAITPVVQRALPGVPVEPAVNCIIDNATQQELLSLASDAVTGPTASTTQIVSTVASRPETLSCLASEGLPVLLGRL